MGNSSMAPRSYVIKEAVPATATAVTDTSNIGIAQEAGVVASVSLLPDAAITGANTNTRLFQLVNKGQAGAGATVIASLQMNAGTNAVANDELPLTLSGTPANLAVAQGDVLAWVSTAVGSGLADPGGVVVIGLARS